MLLIKKLHNHQVTAHPFSLSVTHFFSRSLHSHSSSLVHCTALLVVLLSVSCLPDLHHLTPSLPSLPLSLALSLISLLSSLSLSSLSLSSLSPLSLSPLSLS